MNLKYSLLLLSIACCTIDTNCSASNGQYNIDYNNIDIDRLDKLEKLAGKKYADQNSLSDIYNDYARKITEKYYTFVKNMYKQINNIRNTGNITDEDLQKIWAIVVVRHIHKIGDKLYKLKENVSENDYTLKNFYEIFPFFMLHDIEEYAEKKLGL